MRRALLVLAAVLALTGCGSSNDERALDLSTAAESVAPSAPLTLEDAGCEFVFLQLTGSEFWECPDSVDLTEADLSGVDLRNAKLPGADLSGADLSGMDLFNVNLPDAYLNGVDFSGASLSAADLSGSDLRDADLSGADLSGANLCDADLQGVAVSGTNLSDTKLKTSIAGLNFNNADLTKADTTGCKSAGGPSLPQEAPSAGERNAFRMAQAYLDAMPFSRQGLIDQLMYEGFTLAEATYGADRAYR